ncbi:LOW QUALITY PROTEIN: A-kinase anchor protein 4-like [Morphnus guianensis]
MKLHSQADLCKVDLNPVVQKDQDCKVIGFIDISTLNAKDKDTNAKRVAIPSSNLSALLWWVDPGWTPGAHQSRNITPPPQLDRGEKIQQRARKLKSGGEAAVIKDNEHDNSKTEGAVCLSSLSFQRGSTDELNIVSLLNNILHKYTVGLQQALPASKYLLEKHREGKLQ